MSPTTHYHARKLDSDRKSSPNAAHWQGGPKRQWTCTRWFAVKKRHCHKCDSTNVYCDFKYSTGTIGRNNNANMLIQFMPLKITSAAFSATI
jgi:hypothetical protein